MERKKAVEPPMLRGFFVDGAWGPRRLFGSNDINEIDMEKDTLMIHNDGLRATTLVKWVFISLLIAGGSANAGRTARELKVEEGKRWINGTELYYKIVGTGTPIVILHGGPGLDHTYLLPQMLKLAKHYRLIFFDQRACGRSTSAVDTNSITMNMFADDVEGIRQAFRLGKMNLMGHSWGGLVAMLYAVKYPTNLNSLILVNTTPASSELRNASIMVMAQRGTREDSLARVALGKTDGFRTRQPKVMEQFFRVLFRGSFFNRTYADSLTLSFDTSYATKSRLMQQLYKDKNAITYDLHPRLGRIECPTLIVGSTYDTSVPESNEQIHKSIKGSTLVVLDSCGHFPYIEAPKKFFGEVERFLAKADR